MSEYFTDCTFVAFSQEDALNDFRQRIEHYQEKYQPLHETEEKDYSYLKIYNTGEKIIIHKHEGHIQSRIVYFLMNIHISKRTIYLTRVRLVKLLISSQYLTQITLPNTARRERAQLKRIDWRRCRPKRSRKTLRRSPRELYWRAKH